MKCVMKLKIKSKISSLIAQKVGRFSFVILVIILLVTGGVLGEVLINYSYPVSTKSVKPLAYLARGPDYITMNQKGLFYVSQSGNPANVSSGSIIYINKSISSSYRVLRIYNTASIPCILWINGTLNHVTMYINGTEWRNGTEENIPANTGYIDISFSLTAGSTVTTDYLTFEYNFGNGVVIYYYFHVHEND